MSLEVVRVRSRKELREFIRFPLRLYRGSRYFVPPLEFERKAFFNPKKNPFFSHAEVALYLAKTGRGETLGRISAHIDRNYVRCQGEKTGFFGFFDCVDDLEPATLLFEAAAASLRKGGMSTLLGPMNFTTNDEVGVLVEGFVSLPYIMTPYNFPYYGSLIERCGGRKARDLYAYHVVSDGAPPGFIRRISTKARKSRRITVREVNLKKFDEELELVKKIYNTAWEKNWGFVPMTDDEIRYLAKNLKSILDPALTYFAFVDGEPAGFFMALPDYNLLLREAGGRLFPFGLYKLLFWKKRINRVRVLAMGVLKRFRHLGIEALFLEEIFRKGPSRGYHEAELSWILEDNTVMNRIAAKLSGGPSRTYRIYQKRL